MTDCHQLDLGGEYVVDTHLTRIRPDDIPSNFSANPGKNEWWCRECRHRVTVGDREYGHAVECDHSVAVEGGGQ
jgi:hypothetical protein